MRARAAYPGPRFNDPDDRRLVQIITHRKGAQARGVNIIGVPFDGAVLGRRGASEGPAAIRRAMASLSNYNVELGVGLEGARVFDLGDIVVENEDVIGTHKEIEAEVNAALRRDSLLAILGGDNSISLPSIAACAKKFRTIGLIVIDSHFDLRGEIGGRPSSGSSYGLAIRTVRGLSPDRVVELGVHGFLNSRAYHERAKKLGITVITAQKIGEVGPKAASERAYQVASAGVEAVYLSIDLDSVDLAYVSGVSAPSAGGLSAQSLFDLAFELGRKRKVVAADVVELAPSLDPSGRSERVAASALAYLVAGFVSRR